MHAGIKQVMLPLFSLQVFTQHSVTLDASDFVIKQDWHMFPVFTIALGVHTL